MDAPDIVGNLRIDQAWGSAQVMAVAHEVNGGYYSGPELPASPADSRTAATPATSGAGRWAPASRSTCR